MIEITVSDIKDISGVVLVYTNMCGTCESAKRMLDIVSQTIDYSPFFRLMSILILK